MKSPNNSLYLKEVGGLESLHIAVSTTLSPRETDSFRRNGMNRERNRLKFLVCGAENDSIPVHDSFFSAAGS